MALTLNQKKDVVVMDTLKGMGMTKSALAAFSLKFRRSGYDTATLSEMLRDVISHEIEVYRKQTYATFGMVILVDASGSEDPDSKVRKLEPIELTLPLFGKVTVGYRQYEFAPYHNEHPWETIDVRLHLGRIQVNFCGSWQPVSAYLDEIGTDMSEPFNAEQALTRQCEWWKANGKYFDMQKMPVELAEIVADHALPVVAQPNPMHNCRRLSKLALAHIAVAQAPKHMRLALMYVNTRTHDITKRVLYKTKTFLIQHRPILMKTLHTKFLTTNIRNLTLAFSHAAYLHLFRFDPKNVAVPHKYAIPQLREMKLKTLEIHIGAPSQYAESFLLEDACQVAVVDLIFNAAWPTSKGHPLKISGWVKDSQKKRIDALAKAEQLAYEKWAACKKAATGEVAVVGQYDVFVARMIGEEQGGVRLDGEPWDDDDDDELEGKRGMGLGLMDRLTAAGGLKHYLDCKCATKCSAADWTCKG
jgi:hypothetical protein